MLVVKPGEEGTQSENPVGNQNLEHKLGTTSEHSYQDQYLRVCRFSKLLEESGISSSGQLALR